MLKADLDELESGILEIYSEMFGREIYFIPFDTTTTANIYGENKNILYLDPIRITCRVEMKPFSKIVVSSGLDLKTEIIFEIPSLEYTNILAIDSRSNYIDTLKGKIEYKDVQYKILSIKPKTMIGDTYLTYLIEGVRYGE